MNDQSLNLLHEGIRLQKAGFRSRAARLYAKVPEGDPYRADALNLLGTLRFEEGQPLDAARLIEQAVRLNPRNAAAWGNLGGVAKHLVRPDIAIPCYRRALLLAPDRPDNLGGLSLVERGVGRDQALRRRIILSPVDADGHIEIGNDLSGAGAKAAAIQRFRRVQILYPASPAGAFNQGNALRDIGDTAGAQRCYGRALAIQPGNPNILNNRGLLSFGRGEWTVAEEYFRRSLGRSNDHAPANFNLARTLQKLGRPEEATLPFKRGLLIDPTNTSASCELAGLLDEERWARRALSMNPYAPEPYNRLALLSTRDPTRARVLWWLRKGACMRPDDPDAWYNIGVELGRTGDAASAAKYGWYATRIRDQHALAHLNTALALLAQERFAEGWEEHRRRLDSPDAAPFVRYFAIPEWTDQDIAGKRLLVWGEQGIGDEVQFLTLAPYLLRRGARLTVLTEPRIRPILRRSLPGVEVPDVSNPSGALEDHHGCDLQIALGDLPHRLALFCGGEARPEPWIVPQPERVASLRADLKRRHPGEKLVGITWRSVAPKTGGRRSIPIGLWQEIAAVPGIALISLQYGLKQEDLDAFADEIGQPIDHSHGIEPILDLDGLAALVAAVDLVLCPANNTVHFAGALGKDCWTLLPTKPDWRWGLTREDSLWYPNTRVFRQDTDDAWEPVMQRVAGALRRWAAVGSGGTQA
ncbi:MAG: tetratricopeptide repeat protein [Alphaproteobacteria bacterium]|nr:tetratricopeptide repeat protein [Alphaproteobacteria bacterium]